MKKPSFCIISILSASVALFTVGCGSSVSSRINEKAAVFSTLSAEEKNNIEEGIALPGYSTDMAYMAFGQPTTTETQKDEEGAVLIWTYKTFYPSGRLEAILTEYSRSRNPNLLRGVDVEVGQATVSDHAPNRTSNPMAGGNATSTDSRMGSLDLPDLPVYNLYVFFVDGKIVDLKLESRDGTAL